MIANSTFISIFEILGDSCEAVEKDFQKEPPQLFYKKKLLLKVLQNSRENWKGVGILRYSETKTFITVNYTIFTQNTALLNEHENQYSYFVFYCPNSRN